MTKALALGVLTYSLLLTTPATAEATRPLIRPPTAIKVTKAQIPMSLKEAMVKKTIGLDFEDAKTRKAALAQAKEYIDLRRGGWSKAKMHAWFEACERGMNSKNPNAFCRIEQERQARSETSSGRTSFEKNQERREIADRIREQKFEAVKGKDYQTVYASLAQIGDVSSIVPLAKKAVEVKSCKNIPAAVPAAMGYKIEELFPDKDAVELSKNLYRKASECGGTDLAVGTASFRLGLILMWQKQYGEIETLMKRVEASPESSQYHPRARYWRYQTATSLKNDEGRKNAKESLVASSPMSFQNLAANGDDEAMMSRVISNEMPSIVTRSIVRPDLNGILRGAEALEIAGSAHLAAEVLDRSTNDIATIEPEVRLYAASFLNRIGYALPKFKILSSLFSDSPKLVTAASMELMFPLWYVDLVRSKQNEVDPLLILSLMRQESAFNPRAMSSVGARGLMQVMPATARMVMKVSKAGLLVPETNVAVGTKYFLKRLNQFGGDVELTLAAYNAGAGRVDQWLKRYPTDNKLLFLDFIPFRETREYVSSILRNYYWYTRLYSADASSVALESGKIQSGPSFGKVHAIMAADAGTAARLITKRLPADEGPSAEKASSMGND